MPSATTNNIEVAFLGIAERSTPIREGDTFLTKWNVIGLKLFVPLFFFPTNISGWRFVFAMRHQPLGDITLNIVLKTESGEELGSLPPLLGSFSEQSPLESPPPLTSSRGGAFIVPLPEAWHFVSFLIPTNPILITRPGRNLLTLRRTDGTEEIIGEFECVLFDPPPLTTERIAAIKSDPHATKTLQMTLGCKKCHDNILAYASLERSEQHETQGYIWYENLPETFACHCGGTVIDLRSLKRNMFAPLGNVLQNDPLIASTPLYELSTLNNIRIEFVKLLDSNPREEILQKFLEDNPIMFRQFPADKIFFKPSILTFFDADFAILTPQKELILIEIEKATTNLLIKNGDQAAPLTHAIDQVGNWLHTFDEHRLACLDAMKIARESVATVRGVVIAGRDRGYNADHLRRLKGRLSNSRISLLTFDDLASSLRVLIQQMGRL
jgi:hypothetical protein